MRVDLTIDPGGGRHFDVALRGPADMRMGQVLESLRTIASAKPTTSAWVNGNIVADTSRVGRDQILPGAVLRFGSRPPPVLARSSMLELRVIGGPDAGLTTSLPLGAMTIGRAPACELVLTDPNVSRRHVRVTTSHEVVLVHELQATNATTIDAAPVDCGGTTLRLGQVMRIGDSFIALAGPHDPPAPVVFGDGRILIARRIRRPTVSSEQSFELPVPPPGASRQVGQLVPTAIAMTSGLTVALVVHSAQLLIIAVAMPVAALLASLAEHVRSRRSASRKSAVHQERLARAEAAIESALRSEQLRRRETYPDPPSIHRIAVVRTARLWERAFDDPDILRVRVGTGDMRSELHITRDGTPEVRLAKTAPVVVDLTAGPLDVSGPRAPLVKLVSSLLCQVAVLCSATDVEILGLFTDDTEKDWTWLRWLPHLRRTPATSPKDQEQLASSLTEAVERRRKRTGRHPPPRWLLLLIDVPNGDIHPGIISALAAEDRDLRITAVILAAPSGMVRSSSTVALHGETGTRLRVRGPDGDMDAVADLTQLELAREIARAVAPVADRSDIGAQLNQPLLSLLRLPPTPRAADIVRRWDDSDGRPSTTIGGCAAGAVSVDLARDGPHALVAGTTGSGKSECLQTLIAGLAATHPPEEVAFVLVDYKGGAAFSACDRLPHVAGLVTDLDPLLTERALRALECELRRREVFLARHAVAALDAYRSLAGVPALPRLVIVVDEFAALADEAPELLRGLIDVAQRGRSLGVHLVLATQRPAGVVSADIRANTSLRIALRVNDPAESIDVIGTAAAADIEPGRPGLAILNTAGACTTLQIARISGRSASAAQLATVTRLGAWRAIAPEQPGSRRADPSDDDLNALVDAVASAARITTRPRAEAPWLAPLPAALSACALPASPRDELVHIGLADLPAERTQPPASVDLLAGGTLLLAGAPRSGRTTGARAIALRAAAQLSPERLGITVIGTALKDIADLPQARPVLDVANFDPIAAFLDRFKAQLPNRRQETCPIELLIVDDWEQLVSASEESDLGRTIETLLDIARQAHRARCTVVIAGGRATLNPRIATAAQSVYVLRLADRADYGLVGIPRSAVPVHMPPGRALLAPDGVQVQLALP